MLKKCAILGLTILLVGALALAWLYKETRAERELVNDLKVSNALQGEDDLGQYGRWHALTPEEQNRLVLELKKDSETKTLAELTEERHARLRTDLDKLAAGQMHPGDIADFLYGRGWEQEVEDYKKRKEQREIAQTTSIVCISIGGTILVGCVVFGFFRLLAQGCRRLKERRRARACDRTEAQGLLPELTEIEAHTLDEDAEDETGPSPPRRRTLQGLPQPSSDTAPSTPHHPNQQKERSLFRALGHHVPGGDRSEATVPNEQEDPAAVLLSDEKLGDQKWSPDAEWSAQGQRWTIPEPGPERRRFTPRPKVAVLGREASPLKLDLGETPSAPDAADDLKQQADDLQRQLAEVKKMAQTMQQTTRQSSDPVGNTLKELAQQVSAIREYAACQQNRVEKLQDGYDWSIIRTFCLRVIRCIDNLENRIDEPAHDEGAAVALEEVRDELLFALESSGVEQFQPHIHSEYRGQEKCAEAIKEKESPPKPDQTGKIAKVIRPGYRYIIDEERFKIVRTAQVKLFG